VIADVVPSIRRSGDREFSPAVPMILIWPWFTRLVSWVVDVKAITLWPFIFAREPLSPVVENHERIHLAQQRELLVVGFYLAYVFEFFFYFLRGARKEAAYYSISFEAEAYQHERNLDYLKTRQPYAWRRC
jgi:hypothetical protein